MQMLPAQIPPTTHSAAMAGAAGSSSNARSGPRQARAHGIF
jgi:hypothetical protein